MIKAVIFDLDGTIYVGKTPVPGAVEKTKELREKGVKVIFLTNAATKTRKAIAEKLVSMGFGAQESECYGSSYTLSRYIVKNHPDKPVYAVGEKGMIDELEKAGIAISDDTDIVVAGLDRTFTYEKLSKAHRNIMKGAEFIATNLDDTFPTEDGTEPGAGSIVAAIERCSGKAPTVIGKPNPFVIDLIGKEHGIRRDEILMVGDRQETDIHFAHNCGIKSALVLTGVTKKDMIKERTDYVFGSVADLEF